MPTVQIDTDGIGRKKLRAGKLRRNELLRIRVIKFVIAVGIAGAFPVVLHDVPQQRIQTAAQPLNRIAARIAAHQGAVMIDGVKLIFFCNIYFILGCAYLDS